MAYTILFCEENGLGYEEIAQNEVELRKLILDFSMKIEDLNETNCNIFIEKNGIDISESQQIKDLFESIINEIMGAKK